VADIRAGIEALGFRRDDVLLGFLPPFHSFGLAGNLVMPILNGIRVVHHADPTDARGLVRTVSQYGVSLLFTTPTFLGYMLAQAKEEDFRTLRIVVTGAEKCPEAVSESAARLAPTAKILEGYGITECSPVVSVGRPDNNRPGTVGQPLSGVEVCVVDPETHEPRPVGETGLLLVSGPTIFSGYLNYDGPDPFIELDNRRWYNTGDLTALDEDGFIHFRGRLKRFLKAGGEMISLPALEEPLARKFPPTEDGPQVAVEGIETPQGRRIVLFSTCEIALKDANAILADAGFRGVMRLDDARQIEAIPVLGTGKTDYKVLRKMVTEQVAT
jgi:long-chain-fatty-acid--[acyl-carrier-protein] ligase